MDKKRRFPLFPVLMILLVVLLTAATLYGWRYTDSLLEEYQSSLAKNVIDEYYAHLAAGDYSFAMDLAHYTPDSINTEAEFRKWLDKKYGSYTDLIYIRAIGSADKKTEYRVYAPDGTRVGSIFVRPTEEKTKHGFTLWQVCDADRPQYLTDYSITIPGDATLNINGSEIKDTPFSEKESEAFPSYGNFAAPTVRTYTFTNLIETSVFTVTAADGTRCELSRETENGIVFTMTSKHDDSLESLSKEALELYVSAVNSAESLDEFLEYLVEGTSFHRTMKDYHRWWIIHQPEYKSAQILNLEFSATDYYSAERAVLSASFDYKVVSTVRTETFPTSYKIYFVLDDGQWKIADMAVC